MNFLVEILTMKNTEKWHPTKLICYTVLPTSTRMRTEVKLTGKCSVNKAAVSTSEPSARTGNGHIFRVETVARPNSSVWAGEKAWFKPRTANIIQPDRTRARPIPAEEIGWRWQFSFKRCRVHLWLEGVAMLSFVSFNPILLVALSGRTSKAHHVQWLHLTSVRWVSSLPANKPLGRATAPIGREMW